MLFYCPIWPPRGAELRKQKNPFSSPALSPSREARDKGTHFYMLKIIFSLRVFYHIADGQTETWV